MNETRNRQEIMKDLFFWMRLESIVTGLLNQSEFKAQGWLWIDGFLPEGITNTKRGVDIQGKMWIGNGSRFMDTYRFVVSVPQKMLHARRAGFSVEGFVFDQVRRTLMLEVVVGTASPSHAPQPIESSDQSRNCGDHELGR